MNFRNSSRNWLINHPRMNPYNFSFSGTYRTLTIPIRILPDFLIIGFHKTATTSLYDYLIQHPNIGSATHKELHYFDTYFWRGLGWYKTHFPTKMMKNRIINESSIKSVYIKELSEKKFRLIIGPYLDLKSLKKEYNNLLKFNFENLEIIRNV